MATKRYIKTLLGQLGEDEYNELVSEMLASTADEPDNKAEEMSLVLMSNFTDEAVEMYKNFGKMQGLSTGYRKIDDLTLGLAPGELIMLAGKTSRGKTTLALNIANRVTLAGQTVLFVTLEMTHAEITQRSMFINDCEPNYLNKYGEQELSDKYYKAAAHTVFQATDELKWDSIDKLMEKAKLDMGVDLVIIDHLHYFTRELTNVAEDLGRITKEFKKNAIRHKVPVILISHVRKTGDDKEATMDDMRGSSYMAQDADIVLMVGRLPENPEVTRVKIEKNRNRGFDYNNNIVDLYTDKIKIYDERPVSLSDVPEFENQEILRLELENEPEGAKNA